jgi:beta-xylosidase
LKNIPNLLKILLVFCLFLPKTKAQLWQADLGNGNYQNPILYMDYSDPDVIRVGADYYMVASSFTCQPGIPVLHSTDLVHWRLINHVYNRLPQQRYNYPQHGQGSWAPAIRYHKGTFYVYFCTPEEGLFVAKASHPAQKWTLRHIVDVQKWEDPCPFWDTDGQAYLVRGAVGAGPCYIHKMSADGLRILDNGKLVFEDPIKQPVLEGFKFMEKRNGYYYISTPAGSVPQGWQTVLRSKNIYGPYTDRVVLHQGNTAINGPHQGAFVDDTAGNWWFIHFQDKGNYGRIVHLQPAGWEHDWPTAGIDTNADGIGEPVQVHAKPATSKPMKHDAGQFSDSFDSPMLKKIWQWQAAPQAKWYQLLSGKIRLYTMPSQGDGGSLFFAGNLLLQKFMAPTFTATSVLHENFSQIGDRAGMTIMGNQYSSLVLEKTETGNQLILYTAKRENRRWLAPEQKFKLPLPVKKVYLQTTLLDEQTCSYAYSTNGTEYIPIPGTFKVEKGLWIGAKVGIYALSANINANTKAYADFDFFEVK